MSEKEKEALANRAGFTFVNGGYKLKDIISQQKIKSKRIYERSLISERMFRYYRSDVYITKLTLLAISIILNLQISEINRLLSSYGYCFSKSLEGDMVVLWYLEFEQDENNRTEVLYQINETLQEMELPILGTKVYKV
ncbi:MAG: hypothetical protein ACI4HI_18750 [Lachnospiraceae bacterium]